MATDQIVEVKKRAMKRVHALRDEFENDGWRAHFLELQRFLMNRRGRYLKSADYEPRQGGKQNDEINNGSPEEAVHTASAGMMGGFTSPSVPWFVLKPADPDMAKNKAAINYLWRQQERMYDVFARSNWYQALPTVYEELTVFGTAAMRMDSHPTRTIHCTQHTAGSYYLANGPDGFVDTVVYRYPRTVRQLRRLYGEDVLSSEVRNKIKNDELDHYVKCVNIIELNEGRDRNYGDWRGMKYRSITMEENSKDEEGVLKIGGHEIFPVVTPRTSRRSDDVYGSSRGMRALPDARQLQVNELRGGEALLKMLRPPLNVPNAKMRATVTAGQANVYRGNNSDAIRPTFTVAGFPYGENEDKIAKLEARMKNTLGATAFQQFETLDATGNHQMTVPEVMERRSEKLALLGPTHQSVHTELLHPAITNAWYYMGLNNMLEAPPDGMQEMPLKVEFTSQLALSQRNMVTQGIELLASQVAAMEQSYPGSSDLFDSDAAIRHMAGGFLAPPDVIREEGAVEEIRQARAQAQQQAMQQEQMIAQAEVASKLGNANLGDGSALDVAAEAAGVQAPGPSI